MKINLKQVYNPTFNLPNKSAYTGHVIGNGMTLGLTDGTNNSGLVNSGGSIGLTAFGNNYNTNVGTSPISGGSVNNVSTGITTDGTKSGIIVETDADLVVCIKF